MKDVPELYVDPHRREEFIKIMTERDVIHNFVSQIKNDGSLIWIAENVVPYATKMTNCCITREPWWTSRRRRKPKKPCVTPSCSTIHWSKPFHKHC